MKNLETITTALGKFKGFSNDYLFKTLKNNTYTSTENVLKAIDQIVLEDSACIDIGANIGVMTCIMAKKAKIVFSFEPQKVVFDLLNENLKLNNISNCKTFQNACFSENTDFDIAPQESQDPFVGDMSKGYDHIESIGSISFKKTPNGKVKALRVDGIINSKIDFIKVDAEGGDIDALIGCEKIIKKHKPIILCEYGRESAKAYDRDMKDYISFASSHKYKITQIDPGNLVMHH